MTAGPDWRRVGRCEVRVTSPRATQWLLGAAWVPRSRGEAWKLMALLCSPVGLVPRAVSLLGKAGDVGTAPPHDASMDAIGRLVESKPEDGLDFLPTVGGAHRRILALWGGEAGVAPTLVAKVGDETCAGAFDREAEALRRLAEMRHPSAELVPRLVARGASGGLEALVTSAVPGMPLLRIHRLAGGAGWWQEATFTSCGAALGAFHAHGARAGASFAHGDAWSRNVLVEARRIEGRGMATVATGWVDWEAAGPGDPIDDVAQFLVAGALADLRVRGGECRAIAADGGRLLRWLAAADTRRGRSTRAFVRAWRTAAPLPSPDGSWTWESRFETSFGLRLAAHGLAMDASAREVARSLAAEGR